MALNQKHRVQLHDTLAPIVWEEAIGALLDQFPAHEYDEPATKAFVRVELAEVRTDFADFRSELRTAIGDVQAASKADFAEVRTDFADFRSELRTTIGDVQAASKAGFAEVRTELADLRADLKIEIGDLRTDMTAAIGEVRTQGAQSEARFAERLRQQNVWFTSAMVVAVGLASSLSQLLR